MSARRGDDSSLAETAEYCTAQPFSPKLTYPKIRRQFAGLLADRLARTV